MVTNGSLIAGQAPTTAVGDFSEEAFLGTRSVISLTAGGSLTIAAGGSPKTTSTNYVTCGNGGNPAAGSTVIYTLAGSTNGYDLTNIVVYGGWGDNGRDQQAFTVYYSTAGAPANFVALATVNFNPSIAANLQSATRVSIAYSAGLLASNVAALKFDFTNPSSENGYCGYAQITVFGNPSASLSVPPTLVGDTQPSSANMVVGDQIIFTSAFTNTQPMSYQWQAISGGVTNLVIGATSPTLTLTNLQLANVASYQLVASNALGVAMSTPALLTVSNVPAAVNKIITSFANQTGLGSGTFEPVWTVANYNGLIAGQSPSSSSGNFSLEATGRNVNSLTASDDLGLTQIVGETGCPITTSTNYVTCGNGGTPDGSSAGASVVYTLSGSANGYDLANITVYGGWADNGRDQQAYTVYYSSATAPSNFVQLVVVNFNPSVPNNIQDATRVVLTSSTGLLASNVASVKFDFTSPASENGYCGYAGIFISGTASILPVVPVNLSGAFQAGQTGFIVNIGNMIVGRNYALLSTTNLASATWTTETNFIATQASATLIKSIANNPQKFYRIAGY
jgi:hypothetical protein